MPKPKSFPKCCAPLCDEDAWHRVRADGGENGWFDGDLCAKHYDCFKACYPARGMSVALLRAVTVEALEAALAAQPE